MATGLVDGRRLPRSYGWIGALDLLAALVVAMTAHRLRDPPCRRGLAVPTWNELAARRSVRALLAPGEPRPVRPWDGRADGNALAEGES
ncbi:MAG TPA: hypothetical protein VFV66_19410 [Nonomuraea sp.]|nr:hypothetical protein [Nonomuraea sp.]